MQSQAVTAATTQVRVFYTAPTLIRSLMQSGDDWVKAHDRGSLRVLGTVGEPIGEHAWNWFGARQHAVAAPANGSANELRVCCRPAYRHICGSRYPLWRPRTKTGGCNGMPHVICVSC